MLFHPFDSPPIGDDELRRRLLGSKGAGLAAMVEAGLPVPPGFTLTTEACHRQADAGWDAALDDAVREGIQGLEHRTGKRLGDGERPLLVSVRSGAEVSMPGMMDTVLDVGMNATVEAALASRAGDAAFAADTRCRALRSFAEVVLGAPSETVEAVRGEPDPETLAATLAEAGFVVPDDPVEQVVAAVRSVFESWTSPRARRYREIEGIDHALGTAATVQAMVFGNLDDRSGTGVAFTRDPASGANGLMGDFLPGAQGEDVVAGNHATLPLTDLATAWPAQYAELERIAAVLEQTMADMVDIEFTIESGSLWVLQARRAKRSPIAALRCAIDMAEDPDFPVDRTEAVARCRRYLDDPPTVDDALGAVAAGTTVIARGLAASPGQASGILCTDPDEAVELNAAGRAVILVRRETSPADVHGMAASAGLFTLLGGLVSHAAVVARDWGLPAVVGAAEATLGEDGLVGPGGVVAPGTTVTVDGTAGTLLLGAVGAQRRPAPGVDVISAWARALERSSTASPGRSGSGTPVPFELLHILRIKGMADVDAVVAVTGLDPEVVSAHLRSLAQEGLVGYLDVRDAWRLLDPGRSEHAARLSDLVATIDLDALPYERFLGLNASFKQLCTDWQLRDGEPNDHADRTYDDAVVARLDTLHAQVDEVLTTVASTLPWTARYAERLASALVRLHDGDPKALTGVLCDSYHDVWMELHEDLIITQGIDRAAEGST